MESATCLYSVIEWLNSWPQLTDPRLVVRWGRVAGGWGHDCQSSTLPCLYFVVATACIFYTTFYGLWPLFYAFMHRIQEPPVGVSSRWPLVPIKRRGQLDQLGLLYPILLYLVTLWHRVGPRYRSDAFGILLSHAVAWSLGNKRPKIGSPVAVRAQRTA